jgi:nitrate reductase (NAD(P)H)
VSVLRMASPAKVDVPTPDNWIKRDSRLIPLTGPHPFNAEPPLEEIMKSGFFLPSGIHFVRNHGTVPRLDWDSHTLIVEVLIKSRYNITRDFILLHPLLFC